MGRKRTGCFVLRGHPVAFAPQFPIRLVDCLNQASEAGSFIDWPRTTEAVAKQTQFLLRQEPNSHDAMVGQDDSPMVLQMETNGELGSASCFASASKQVHWALLLVGSAFNGSGWSLERVESGSLLGNEAWVRPA